jgi:hypothetical protein
MAGPGEPVAGDPRAEEQLRAAKSKRRDDEDKRKRAADEMQPAADQVRVFAKVERIELGESCETPGLSGL